VITKPVGSHLWWCLTPSWSQRVFWIASAGSRRPQLARHEERRFGAPSGAPAAAVRGAALQWATGESPPIQGQPRRHSPRTFPRHLQTRCSDRLERSKASGAFPRLPYCIQPSPWLSGCRSAAGPRLAVFYGDIQMLIRRMAAHTYTSSTLYPRTSAHPSPAPPPLPSGPAPPMRPAPPIVQPPRPLAPSPPNLPSQHGRA